MMITGQKPIKKSKQGRFQIVDIVELMKPITKYTRQVVNANNIAAMVRESFRLAMEERPGAVHLELPEDIAAEESLDRVFDVVGFRRPDADEQAIQEAVKMIENAKMPLLLIGAGANRKRTSKALTEFIEKTGIYFFNTQMGKGVVDERHPQFLGTAALSNHDFLHCAINRADLIINIGHDVIEKPPFFMKHGGTPVLHINFFPAKVDNVYFPQSQVIGYIANAMNKISEKITPQKNWDFSIYEENQRKLRADILNKSDSEDFPLLPQRIVQDVRKSMPKDGIVCLDNGMYKIWFARNYRCFAPNTLLLDNALATMGAGLPSAMATALIYPEKKVLAVTGDGGFMMNSQELETAIRLQLSLTVLIINDNAYG